MMTKMEDWCRSCGFWRKSDNSEEAFGWSDSSKDLGNARRKLVSLIA